MGPRKTRARDDETEQSRRPPIFLHPQTILDTNEEEEEVCKLKAWGHDALGLEEYETVRTQEQEAAQVEGIDFVKARGLGVIKARGTKVARVSLGQE